MKGGALQRLKCVIPRKLSPMTPAGYMAKRVCMKPDYLKAGQVADIYSVSGCVSSDFADYIDHWKHNGEPLCSITKLMKRNLMENNGGYMLPNHRFPQA
jgi:hypothetical protein